MRKRSKMLSLLAYTARVVVSLTTISIVTIYSQFLQQSSYSSSFSLIFTLSVTPFNLKFQVEALRYLVPLRSVVQNCTKRTLEIMIGKVHYCSWIYSFLRSRKQSIGPICGWGACTWCKACAREKVGLYAGLMRGGLEDFLSKNSIYPFSTICAG